MREKDITEKALENFNDVFADVVNALVFDGEQCVKVTELEQVLPRGAYKEMGVFHEQERDVVKAWKHGTIRIAMLALENQTEIDYDMPLRIISCDGPCMAHRWEVYLKGIGIRCSHWCYILARDVGLGRGV